MGDLATFVDRLDGLQRRHPVVGFPLAVLDKFVDDQGNYLAAVVTYYAFVSVFPLLLIASSGLGFVLQGNAELKDEVLTGALSRFPIVGTELGKPQSLQGSTSAVVVGTLAALYGVLGLGQAALNAVNETWAVPRNSRFNPLLSRASSLMLLVIAGLTVLGVTVLSSIVSHMDMFGPDADRGLGWLLTTASILMNISMLAVRMRLATAARQSFRSSLPGAVVVALMWQLLQHAGGTYVSRVIARVNDVNAVFAVVLGLLAFLYIASLMAVVGLEINVVLAKRLYPRSLLTPFTDAVTLTEGDRQAYTGYAQAQRHEGFQEVRVSFGPPGDSEKRQRHDSASG